ncbi:MAG: adenylate kinase family protein [Halanaeroarchaeum sp.]
MRLAVTGTPGTGKTTATDLVESPLGVVHLNELVREESLYTSVDETRDSLIADIDAIEERLADREDVIVESHLSHRLSVDAVVVLRCAPAMLADRLRERGADEKKASENAESEALDVILSEAVERHGTENVYEIDTTDRSPEAVASRIEAVVRGDREPSAGEVDFTEYV